MLTGATGNAENGYAQQLAFVNKMKKRGEAIYFIHRRPGIPLSGTTIWTWDSTGELRQECAAVLGRLINGVEIDEQGFLYVFPDRIRFLNGRRFLRGKGGTFGGKPFKGNQHPMTGTIMKLRGRNARVLLKRAVVPMSPGPERAPDFYGQSFPGAFKTGPEVWGWMEGAEWLYAGASPTRFNGCKCPSPRFHVDWYKRTFALEAYRHSIGVLDTNGNVVMHIGRYGNFDSSLGPKSQVPLGGDGIGVFHPRAVAVTDNYITYSCWGERVMVLKIGYHAQESVKINVKK